MPAPQDNNRDTNRNEQFSLIITNLTRDQQAIIARQDKVEGILNSNQVLLATMQEQQRQHSTEILDIAVEMRDLKKEGNETNKQLTNFAAQMNIIKIVGSSILTLGIGYLFAHFVR